MLEKIADALAHNIEHYFNPRGRTTPTRYWLFLTVAALTGLASLTCATIFPLLPMITAALLTIPILTAQSAAPATLANTGHTSSGIQPPPSPTPPTCTTATFYHQNHPELTSKTNYANSSTAPNQHIKNPQHIHHDPPSPTRPLGML